MDIFVLVINLLVLIMFVRYRYKLLTTTNNMLLCSMSVADCSVGLTGIIDWVLLREVDEKIDIWKLSGALPFFVSF